MGVHSGRQSMPIGAHSPIWFDIEFGNVFICVPGISGKWPRAECPRGFSANANLAETAFSQLQDFIGERHDRLAMAYQESRFVTSCIHDIANNSAFGRFIEIAGRLIE